MDGATMTWQEVLDMESAHPILGAVHGRLIDQGRIEPGTAAQGQHHVTGDESSGLAVPKARRARAVARCQDDFPVWSPREPVPVLQKALHRSREPKPVGHAKALPTRSREPLEQDETTEGLLPEHGVEPGKGSQAWRPGSLASQEVPNLRGQVDRGATASV
jgi:hypothetical protein